MFSFAQKKDRSAAVFSAVAETVILEYFPCLVCIGGNLISKLIQGVENTLGTEIFYQPHLNILTVEVT